MLKFVTVSALLVAASAAPTPPTGAEGEPAIADEAVADTPMQTVQSAHSFEKTVSALKDFIEEKGLTLFAEIDHAKGAEEVGLNLAPATVLVFGNPKAGTLLMQDDINIAVDLPLKVLVFMRDEKVMLGYRVPSLTLNHYNLDAHRGILNKMDGLFKKMTEAVANKEGADVNDDDNDDDDDVETNEEAEVPTADQEAEVMATEGETEVMATEAKSEEVAIEEDAQPPTTLPKMEDAMN